MWREGRPAMKENIVIPIKIERVKIWFRRALETATWLICLGLLAASVLVAVGAALLWLVSGSEVILALGLGSGLLLGLAGVWHLLRKLDRAVHHLRGETPAVGGRDLCRAADRTVCITPHSALFPDPG